MFLLVVLHRDGSNVLDFNYVINCDRYDDIYIWRRNSKINYIHFFLCVLKDKVCISDIYSVSGLSYCLCWIVLSQLFNYSLCLLVLFFPFQTLLHEKLSILCLLNITMSISTYSPIFFHFTLAWLRELKTFLSLKKKNWLDLFIFFM